VEGRTGKGEGREKKRRQELLRIAPTNVRGHNRVRIIDLGNGITLLIQNRISNGHLRFS